MTNTTYKPGDEIGGSYRVHAALAGGMGEVYLCRTVREDAAFALKTLSTEALRDPAGRKLFEHEVGVWADLGAHPHVVRCYCMDTLADRPFMFLEWVEGEPGRGTDLRAWLARQGRLAPRDALGVAIDVCRGLVHAHERVEPLVHRDLKPENVLVARGNEVKITDFGLARLADSAGDRVDAGDLPTSDDRRQHLSRIGGTPPYMAPEQWRGEPIGVYTDLYAVGVMLYELLTGQRPYDSGFVRKLREMHCEGAVPALGEVSGLSPAVGAVIERCLQKAPQARYPSARSLLEALEDAWRESFGEEPRPMDPPREFTSVDHHVRGITYYNLDRKEEALADFERAIALDPGHARAFNSRGVILSDQHRYEEALADHDRAVSLDPDLAEAVLNRAYDLNKLRRYEEALADCDRAIELVPDRADAFFNRGTVRHALQRDEEALADYDRALALKPDDAATFLNRGNACHALQRHDEAFADYDRAIALEPDYAEAFYNRGIACWTVGRNEEAYANLTRAVALKPDYADAFHNRGVVLNHLKRHEEALADYDRALALEPAYVGAFVGRGDAHNRLGHFDEALADFARAIELDPDHAGAHLDTGVIHFNLGRVREALSWFEQAARLGHPQGIEYAEIARGRLADEAGAERGPSPAPPAPRSDTISGETLTTPALQTLLESAGLSCRPDSNGNLVLEDRWHAYLLSDPGDPPRYVRAVCAFDFEPDAPALARLELANRINGGVVALRAAVSDDRLVLDACLWLTGGAAAASVVALLRVWPGLVDAALACNEDGLLT